MAAVDGHQTAVVAWLRRLGDTSAPSLIAACERMFAALWQRTHLVLGEVTLVAIVERVLHAAKDHYPFLVTVEVDASGLHCGELGSVSGLQVGDVSAAIQFVLVEFLTVLGNLTADILTPALHAELARGHTDTTAEPGR